MKRIAEEPMSQFKYAVLPPAIHGGAPRAFLFVITHFSNGSCGYSGMNVQNTVWMKRVGHANF